MWPLTKRLLNRRLKRQCTLYLKDTQLSPLRLAGLPLLSFHHFYEILQGQRKRMLFGLKCKSMLLSQTEFTNYCNWNTTIWCRNQRRDAYPQHKKSPCTEEANVFWKSSAAICHFPPCASFLQKREISRPSPHPKVSNTPNLYLRRTPEMAPFRKGCSTWRCVLIVKITNSVPLLSQRSWQTSMRTSI